MALKFLSEKSGRKRFFPIGQDLAKSKLSGIEMVGWFKKNIAAKGWSSMYYLIVYSTDDFGEWLRQLSKKVEKK